MRLPCMAAACSFLLALSLHAQTIDRLQYQFPASSATLVSRQSSIILRPGPLLEAPAVGNDAPIVVTGSKSGRHGGRTLLSDDRRTVQFVPDRPFAAGEVVRVEMGSGLRAIGGEVIAPHAFSFTVDRTSDSTIAHTKIPSEIDGEAARSRLRKERPTGILSADPAGIPAMTVTTLDNPAPGRIYLANLAFSATVATSPHLMILDNAARPLYRQPLTDPGFDFKRQPDGTLSYFDDGLGYFIILDSAYRPIRTIACGNGHITDPHELLILPNGHALLLGLSPHTVDLTNIVPDGSVATVIDVVIQELDASENVVFEWSSVGNFEVTDATHEDLTAESIDHVHPNSLEVDYDGNILISSRHLDEVTKIDRTTGVIIWRMGGRKNQFTFPNDPERFSHQHDVRRLPNGNILMFDNGNFHTARSSRAVEYRLDEATRTATVVWQYHHSPAVYSYAMGNAQRLPNGNTMIGWGAYPLVTEVRPDGSTAFEMTLPDGVFTYRAFRLPAATSRVKVALAEPADGTTDLPLLAPLSWEQTGATESFRVQVASDSTFATIVHDGMVTDAEQAMVGPLSEWTRYWWRVKAAGSEIAGVWSEMRSFYTGGAPIYQALVAPPEGTREMAMAPTLHWGRFPGAESYQVQLSNYDVAFGAPQIDTTITSQWLWLDSIQSRSQFYWRVRPVVAGEIGNWSPIWDFATASALADLLPDRLLPIAPADDARVLSSDIEFLWAPDGSGFSPTAFRLEVAADRMFANHLLDSTLGELTLRIPAGVLPNGHYWWRVRATNAAGEQYRSPVFAFDLSPAVGVDEASMTGSIALHPNPAGGTALLQLPMERGADVTVHLVDPLGRTVATPFAGMLSSGPRTIPIPLAGIANGTYFCTISTGGTTIVRRLVVRQ